MARQLGVGLLVAAGGLALAWGQGTPLKMVRNFRSPDYYERAANEPTNRLRSLVTGAEAYPVLSNLWCVRQTQIESYELDGRTNLVARAPECLLDVKDRVLSSTNRIAVATANGQLYIEGQGFFFRLTNLHFIVSNRVRTVIERSLLSSATP